MLNNTISAIWTKDLSEIEKYFNYTFSDEIKQYVKNKCIRCCSKQINFALGEELLVLAFNPYENQCYKYGESITVRLKGTVQQNKVYEYVDKGYLSVGGCI